MKNLKCMTIMFIVISIIKAAGYCAVYYVRAGAAGNNDGTDWVNAYTQLPVTLVRGATYYIASGTYPAYTMNTTLSGIEYITVKKATVGEHGTDAGWNDSYASGQAAITGGIVFIYGYFILDGQTGGGPGNWKTGHGFKIGKVGSTPSNWKTIDFRGPSSHWWSRDLPTHISLLHIEFEHNGGEVNSIDDIIYSAVTSSATIGPTHIHISHCYLHEPRRLPFNTYLASNWLIENNFIARNHSGFYQGIEIRGEGIQDFGSNNMIIRNNIWEDVIGTGVIVLKRNYYQTNNNWLVYGNVFLWKDEARGVGMHGVFGKTTGHNHERAPASSMYFYDNIIIRGVNGRPGLFFHSIEGTDPPHDSVVSRNNVYYDCWQKNGEHDRGNVIYLGNIDYDYETVIYKGENNNQMQNLSGNNMAVIHQYDGPDIFQDWRNYDFRLTAAGEQLVVRTDFTPPDNREPADVSETSEHKKSCLTLYNNIIKGSGAQTAVKLFLAEAGNASVKIYDSKGREIIALWDGHREAGSLNLSWDGTDASGKKVGSGVYMVHMKSGSYSETKKIVVVK